MGFRFRKSKKIGPVRINFSKSGIGYSIGGKGARITKTANGRTRTTLSVPGTGVSYVTESGSKRRRTKVQGAAPLPRRSMGCCVIVIIAIIIFIVAFVCISKKDSSEDVGDSYNQSQIVYAESHPRIYDTVESVEQYINEQDTSAIKLVKGSDFAKMNYDGEQSESDGVVCYEKGATHKDLVEAVRIIIDDSDFAKTIDIDEAVSIMNSYLPTDFYDVYGLDCAFIRSDNDTSIYTAAFRKQDQESDYAAYMSIYLKSEGGNSWVLENGSEAYGGLDKGQVSDYETWEYDFYK